MCRIQCLGVLRQGWCRADLFLLLKITPTTIAVPSGLRAYRAVPGPFFHPPLPKRLRFWTFWAMMQTRLGKAQRWGIDHEACALCGSCFAFRDCQGAILSWSWTWTALMRFGD